jgi:hypothetical protein
VAEENTNSLGGYFSVIGLILRIFWSGKKVLDEYICVLCTSRQEESVEHLFFNCTFSQWFWRLLHISWSHLDNHLDRIVDGRRRSGNRIYKEIFSNSPLGYLVSQE